MVRLQNWPRRRMTMCLASGCVSILQPRCRSFSMVPWLSQDVAHFSRYACSAKQSGILIHVERHAANTVRIEHARTEIMYES